MPLKMRIMLNHNHKYIIDFFSYSYRLIIKVKLICCSKVVNKPINYLS